MMNGEGAQEQNTIPATRKTRGRPKSQLQITVHLHSPEKLPQAIY